MIAKPKALVNTQILGPRTLVNAGNIPRELRQYRQFVVWRYEDHGRPKLEKVPKNCNSPKLANAGPHWPNTWTDILSAIACYEAHQCLNGVGFFLTQADQLTMVDLDNCLQDGAPNAFAQNVIDRLGTYCEISPSRNSLRLFVRCEAQPPTLKRDEVEIYSSAHYATLTGNVLVNAPIADANLTWLYDMFPSPVVTANNDPHFFLAHGHRLTPSGDDLALWQYIFRVNSLAQPIFNNDLSNVRGRDPSRAVILLLNSLALWTQGDAGRMARMIRMAHLDQSKWDEKRGTQTWLQGQILDAISYVRGQ